MSHLSISTTDIIAVLVLLNVLVALIVILVHDNQKLRAGRHRADRAERILAALREPSVEVASTAYDVFEELDDMSHAIPAAVAAAEKEVDA